DFLRRTMVAFFGGADEVVVRARKPLHHRLEQRHVAVQQLPRRDSLAQRGLLHFLPVLVGAGEKKDVIAVQPHEARDRIGGDRLIGVADMRRAVRIGDRRGDVIARLRHDAFLRMPPADPRGLVGANESAGNQGRGRIRLVGLAFWRFEEGGEFAGGYRDGLAPWLLAGLASAPARCAVVLLTVTTASQALTSAARPSRSLVLSMSSRRSTRRPASSSKARRSVDVSPYCKSTKRHPGIRNKDSKSRRRAVLSLPSSGFLLIQDSPTMRSPCGASRARNDAVFSASAER